jgi:hypothetical protein
VERDALALMKGLPGGGCQAEAFHHEVSGHPAAQLQTERF